MKKMQIDGKVVKFYFISEVAKASCKTGGALRKLLARGLMPEANYRAKSVVSRDGVPVPGARLYSEAIYPELVAWLKSVRKGSKITDKMQLHITLLFKSERQKILDL
jgi:hypothetical protein